MEKILKVQSTIPRENKGKFALDKWEKPVHKTWPVDMTSYGEKISNLLRRLIYNFLTLILKNTIITIWSPDWWDNPNTCLFTMIKRPA